MWTWVSPAGGGSAGGFCAEVFGEASGDLPSVVVVALVGAASTGVVELDVLSTGGVDEASVGVDEAIESVGSVEVEVESVEVAATCARTGLTTANPIRSATTRALAPTNVMMFVFIIRLLS